MRESAIVDRNDHRSLLDEFMAHVEDGSETAWLSGLIDGSIAPNTRIPRDEQPVDYLIALLRQSPNDHAIRVLGNAAGALLRQWLEMHPLVRAAKSNELNYLGTVLSVLSRVPAAPDVAQSLYELCQQPEIRGLTADIGDLRYEVLLALAVSDSGSMKVMLLPFFQAELPDPDYTVAAFTGLRRLSLESGVSNFTDFYQALKRGGLPPYQPLWSLFAAMSDDTEQAFNLGCILSQPENARLGDEVTRLLQDDLRIEEDFPEAWQSYVNGRETGRSTHPASPADYAARTIDESKWPEIRQAAATCRGRALLYPSAVAA